MYTYFAHYYLFFLIIFWILLLWTIQKKGAYGDCGLYLEFLHCHSTLYGHSLILFCKATRSHIPSIITFMWSYFIFDATYLTNVFFITTSEWNFVNHIEFIFDWNSTPIWKSLPILDFISPTNLEKYPYWFSLDTESCRKCRHKNRSLWYTTFDFKRKQSRIYTNNIL